MRYPVVTATFLLLLACAACRRTTEPLSITPPVSPESLFVRGIVTASDGLPVQGASIQLTVVDMDLAGSATVGECSGSALQPPLSTTSAANGGYSIGISTINVHPRLCIALQVLPPAGSTFGSTLVSRPNAFPFVDQPADTLSVNVALAR